VVHAELIYEPSPQQKGVFDFVEDRRGGNAIVEAVAGAGKTTTLIRAMERMQGQVFYGVFNTKMAKEAKEKASHLRNVWIKTFHSMGMGALNFRLGKDRVQIDDKKLRKLVDALVLEKQRQEIADMANATVKTVSMAKQRGIGPVYADTDAVWLDMIDHFGLDEDLPEGYEDRLDILVKSSRIVLRRSNIQAEKDAIIDFDDMVYLPLHWNLRMGPRGGFQWVLVDEAQDTNPTRREFAKRLMAPGGRFIAVGDPHQAIYGFSGADNDALDQIARDFNAKPLPLTITYRCPKAVVKVAQEFVQHIQAGDTAPEGLFVEELEFGKIVEELQPGDAVLSRYNKYLVGLCFRLIREGKPAKIEGRAIGEGLINLTRKWKVKKLETLAERIGQWKEREMRKALAKDNETKAQEVEDRAETLFVLITRAQEQGIVDADGLRAMIAGLFADNVADDRRMIVLCSCHKSKGLEWNRVFVLGLYELMGREQNQPWQTQQERNLCYVAITRAMDTLVNVTGVREERKQHQFGQE